MERSRFSIAAACLLVVAMVVTGSAVTAQWSTKKLSSPRTSLSATSVGNKAFFAGGLPLSNVVDVFNDGTMTTATLSVARSAIGAGSLGTKAFFAGGLTASGVSSVVDIFDTNNSQWTIAALSLARSNVVTATVGSKVLFAGGKIDATTYSNVVDIFDGTNWTTSTLLSTRRLIGAATVGTKAYFVGGNTMDVYDVTNGQWASVALPESVISGGVVANGANLYIHPSTDAAPGKSGVIIYNSTDGSWKTGNLTSARAGVTLGTVGFWVFFAGGEGVGYETTSDLFKNLGPYSGWGLTSISIARRDAVSTTAGTRALFAGGTNANPSDQIDIYDNSCTASTNSQLFSVGWGEASLCSGGEYLASIYTSSNQPEFGKFKPLGEGASITQIEGRYYFRLTGSVAGSKSLTAESLINGCLVHSAVTVNWSSAACPTITSATPTSGPPGTVIQIMGSNFTADPNTTSIQFSNGGTGIFESASPSTWSFKVPEDAITGPVVMKFGSNIIPVLANFKVLCDAKPIPITVNPVNPIVCGTASVTLTASGAATYTWSPSTGLSATTGQTVVASPVASTTYTVFGTNANGCSGSFPVRVLVETCNTPTITSFSPIRASAGSEVAISGSGFRNYSRVFFNGTEATVVGPITSGSIVVIVPAGATSGKITIANGSATTQSSQSFEVCKQTSISVTSETTICQGSSITLNAFGATNYSWAPADGLSATTGNVVVASPTTTTMYTVTNVTPGECSVPAKTNVVVVPCNTSRLGRFGVDVVSGCIPFTVKIVSSNLLTTGECSGSKPCQVTISGRPPVTNSFSWQFQTEGKFIVQIKYSDGVIDDIEIEAKPLPTISVNSPTICQGESVLLTASGADTYQWTGFGSGATLLVRPSQNASYTVTGKLNGCTNSAVARVTVVACSPISVIASEEDPLSPGTASPVTMVTSGGAFEKSATLFHRPLRSKSPYTSEAPVGFNGNKVQIPVSADWLDELGMEYYVAVSDAQNGRGTSEINVKQKRKIPNAIEFSPGGRNQEDYRIISIPRRLTDQSIKTVFKDLFDKYGSLDETKWRLVRYQSGGNVNAGTGFTGVDIGRGYWFISTEPFTLNIVADPINVSQKLPISIRLEKGWNQIGNPFDFDISWTSILQLNTNPSGIGKLFAYDATKGFYETDVLKAWSGGFVNSTSSVTIDVPVFVALASGRRTSDATAARIDEPTWFLPLQIQHGGYESNTGGIGMDPTASLSRDAFDESTLPRWPKYVDISFPHPEYFQKTFTREFVPTADAYTWTFDVESTSPTGDATIRWESSPLSLANAQLFLYDSEGGMLINMKRSSQYSFKLNGIKKFKILFARSGEKFVSDGFMVGAPFPNPSRDQISIPIIQHAAATSVSATVFDMLGRPVRQLQGEATERVYSELTWDGTDAAGNHVTQGTYIIRLTDGQTVYTHRVVIHKGQ